MNKLFFGDNLGHLRNHDLFPSESVDLVYLDPPFNSQRNYNLLFKQHKGAPSQAQIMAFEDTWQWSGLEYERFKQDPRNERLWRLVDALYSILNQSEMMAYVVMMAPRLLELRRVLKPTGSLYLHCDPVASHYLKIILDVVFGPTSFVNEIIWKRTTAHGDARRKFGDVSDTLLFYARSDKYKFARQTCAYDEAYLEREFSRIDESGRRYALDNLSSPNPRPNLTYAYKGFPPPKYGWRYSVEQMERLDAEGRLLFPPSPSGRIRLKRYLDEQHGMPVGNVWTDIPPVHVRSNERRGYPTQKPLALLERIIAASSDEGDVLLDPFCGCGTAVVAAERMRRKWIGIDVTYLAINEIADRLRTEGVEGKTPQFELIGTPRDAYAARKLFEDTEKQNHRPFEQWAVTLVGARWSEKKGADAGKDGAIGLWDADGKYREAIVQVKGGALTLSAVRDFAHVIERDSAVLGILLCMREATKDMRAEADKLGFADWPSQKQYPRMQILPIQDILEHGLRAEVPDSYRIQPETGIGKKQPGQLVADI